MTIDLEKISFENGKFIIDEDYLKKDLEDQFWRLNEETIKIALKLFRKGEVLKAIGKSQGVRNFGDVILLMRFFKKEDIKKLLEETKFFLDPDEGLLSYDLDHIGGYVNKEQFNMILGLLDKEEKERVENQIFEDLMPRTFYSAWCNFNTVKELYPERLKRFKKRSIDLIKEKLEEMEHGISDALRVGRGSYFDNIIDALEFISIISLKNLSVKQFVKKHKDELVACIRRRLYNLRCKLRIKHETAKNDERIVKILLKFIPEDERKPLEKDFLVTVI